MEKIFRDRIREAWVALLKQDPSLKRVKAPVEYAGDLAGSQFSERVAGGCAVNLVLVLAQGSPGIGLRLYWRTDAGAPLEVTEAEDVTPSLDESMSMEGLAARIRGTSRAVLYADTLVCSSDDLYVEAFPPRSRIRPLMELPELVAEMGEIEPSALEQGWEGNGGWDNWATVSMYAGPLNVQDAEYATARPIAAMKRTLEQCLFPLTNLLLGGAAHA